MFSYSVNSPLSHFAVVLVTLLAFTLDANKRKLSIFFRWAVPS